MLRWWEYDRERYQREIEDLVTAGIEYERDELAFSAGKLVLHIRFPINGELLDLTIKYPDTYPFFRPHVIAPRIKLAYHQHPNDKNLCLLDQPTDSWNIEETAYTLLVQQLPKVLAAGASTDSTSVDEIETHQAEPRSAYYQYHPRSVLLIDGAWQLDGRGDRGLFVIGFEPNTDPNTSVTQCLRGAILELQTESGAVFETSSVGVREHFSSKQTIKGHWFRVPSAPDIVDSDGLIHFLRSNHPRIAHFIEARVKTGGNGVVALVFPEERQWRGGDGVGWLFLTFFGPAKKSSPPLIHSYLTIGDRSGPADLRERVPELHSLADKKIAVVGCGCVGAPSVFEFAKCGVGEIRLWDGDSLSSGNTCRWPLGTPYSGFPKAQILAGFLRAQYPQTQFGPCAYFKLGDANANEASAVEKLLDGVDLVFDATAERGVQLYLSSMARAMGKPYVMAESRPGGWGGITARILPGSDSGCYYCFLHSLTDGSIQPPPSKDENFIQPQGCISPTFTAASFDTSTISMAAVRLAVSTMIGTQTGDYPSMAHDVGVLSLRDPATGQATFPNWKPYILGKHPDCHCKN